MKYAGKHSTLQYLFLKSLDFSILICSHGLWYSTSPCRGLLRLICGGCYLLSRCGLVCSCGLYCRWFWRRAYARVGLPQQQWPYLLTVRYRFLSFSGFAASSNAASTSGSNRVVLFTAIVGIKEFLEPLNELKIILEPSFN